MDSQEWLAGYQSPPPATQFVDDDGDTCDMCEGRGEIESDEATMMECPECHGTGKTPAPEPEPVRLTEAFSAPYDLGPSGAEADAVSEAKRLAENERFKIWEDGFMAGMVSVNGEHRKNPYEWHGLGFVPKDAALSEIRVRVFVGTREVQVGQVGSIVRDRRGTQISQVFIHPEVGSR